MASIQYVVNATDAASGVFAKIAASADGLDKQLADLSKRVATPEVNLKDAKFTLGMVRAAERLDKLSAMVADPEITVDGAKAQTEILRITAMLDRLDAKRVSVSVDVDRSLLSRLGGGLGGLGGLLGGAGGAIGGGISSLGQYGQGALYGIGGALAALLAPAALPLGLGALVGGGGALAGLQLGSTAHKQLLQLQKSLRSVTGSTPSANARRAFLQAQIERLRDTQGTQLALGAAGAGLQRTLTGTFLGALTANARGPLTGGNRGGEIAGTSFLAGLTGILKQLGGFIKSIGPQLGDLFRASLPFVAAFVKFLEQAAKILLPVFVQMLHEMTPVLPVISKGLLDIVKGFAGFLNAIGPSGMKASARIFVVLAEGMAAVLVALGHTLNWLAENIPTWIRKIHNEFDVLRHETAVIFDGIRHEIAHIWDMIFSNTIGRVIRGGHDIEREWNTWTHNIGVIFDGFRHDVAAVWDTIWNNTIGRIKRGIGDAVGWFKGLPGKVINALGGLGTDLYNFARMALTKLWNGAKSMVKPISDFFSGFASGIVGIFKKIWGWFSPSSVMYEGGKALMQGLEKGIKDHAHLAVSQAAAAAHQVANVGAGVQRWAPLVKRALAMEGLSQGLLGNVLYQMSTESGGNPNAINLTDSNAMHGDPSRGLMQVIMGTFRAYHWPGTSGNIYDPLANIAAALNYARHVYGPSLMSGGMGIGSGHGYAAGSWNVPYTGPALVHAGEMIIPAAAAAAVRAGGGGNSYQITVNVPPSANKADIGRQVVETIREFEKRSGAGWRS